MIYIAHDPMVHVSQNAMVTQSPKSCVFSCMNCSSSVVRDIIISTFGFKSWLIHTKELMLNTNCYYIIFSVVGCYFLVFGHCPPVWSVSAQTRTCQHVSVTSNPISLCDYVPKASPADPTLPPPLFKTHEQCNKTSSNKTIVVRFSSVKIQ